MRAVTRRVPSHEAEIGRLGSVYLDPKSMAFWAIIIMGLGLSFYIRLGFR